MSLEESLDDAVTALRVAGQQALSEILVSRADLAVWGWAFTECIGALGFVCQRLSEQLAESTTGLISKHNTGAGLPSETNELYLRLLRLGAALERAGELAREYSALAHRFSAED